MYHIHPVFARETRVFLSISNVLQPYPASSHRTGPIHALRPTALEDPSSSRYLATVRRETAYPASASSWHSFWSEQGRLLSLLPDQLEQLIFDLMGGLPLPAPTSRGKKKLRG